MFVDKEKVWLKMPPNRHFLVHKRSTQNHHPKLYFYETKGIVEKRPIFIKRLQDSSW